MNNPIGGTVGPGQVIRLAQLTGGPGAAASNSRAGPSKPERR